MKGQNGSLATRLRQVRQTQREHALNSAGTARELVIVAFAVPLVTLLVLTVIVAITLALSGAGFAAFGTALGSAWLSLHQVPLSIGGVGLSTLPLLPAIALVAAVFIYTGPSARLRTTPSDLAALVGAAVGGPLLITALALAVVLDGSSVLPVNPPNALWAFLATVAVYGGGTVAGIARRDWREWCGRLGIGGARLDDLVVGLRTGALAALMLIGAGAVAVCALLILNWQSVAAVVAEGNRFDGYLGLVVVSLLYLPNVVVDAAAALLGTPVPIGTAIVDVFNPQTGAVPALPILAIVPGAPPIRFLWATALAVPLAIGVWAAMRTRHIDPARNLRRVAISAATVAVLMLVATAVAGGSVGELGRAGADAPLAAALAFAWVAVIGVVTALANGLRRETKEARRAAAAAAPAADTDDGAGTDDATGAETKAEKPVAAPTEPTPVFYRPDDDAPVIDDLEDLMFVDDLPAD